MINLGYVPEDDFAKGIKEVIQWYKENLQERKMPLCEVGNFVQRHLLYGRLKTNSECHARNR